MPGAPAAYMPGTRRYDEDRIWNAISDATVAVDELTGKLGERFGRTISPALETVNELRSRMEGTAANEIDAINQTVDKLKDKLQQRVIDRMSEAYGVMIPLGYTLPTADDLTAATVFAPTPTAPATQPIQSPEVPDQRVILPSEPVSFPPSEPREPTDPTGRLPDGGVFIPTPDGGKTCPFGALGDHTFECRIDSDGVWRCYIQGPIAAPGRELCIDWWNIPTECRPPWPEFPWPDINSSCYLGDPPDDSGEWMGHWLVRGPCHGSTAIILESCTNGPPPGWKCEAKDWRKNPACKDTLPPQKPGPVPPKPEECKPHCPPDWNEKEPVCKPLRQDDPIPDRPKPPEDKGYCEHMDDEIDRIVLGQVGELIRADVCEGGGGTISKAISLSIIGQTAPIIPYAVNKLAEWIKGTVEKLVKRTQCNIARLMPIAVYHGAVKFIAQWFGIVPKAALNSLQQMENLACQTVMPDQPSTDSARLADTISKERWECWTRLNGSVLSAAEVGVETRRVRPDPLQLCRLFRQDKIKEEEWKKRIRQDGVIKDEDRTAFFDLTQQWPTASDLNPWMIRDVWDEKTIDWSKVDDLFDKKFTGESEKLFKAIGWTKDLAKLAWRAHFHLPSFTMVAEMYHRFRNRPEGDPLRTNIEKIRNLLIQDDWHPDWIDRMLAITFKPMRLVDIRNAYNMRVIDDGDLQDRLRTLGYDDKTVDVTFKYWKRQREIRDARQGGIPGVGRLIKQYANCEIDAGTFQSLVSLVVETPEQENYAFQAAEIARDSEDARRTIAGISWQYRRGIISEAEAAQFLSQAGIDPTCIPGLVERMKRQAAQKPKQLAAGSLCKMLEQGIITPPEMVNALMRAGWMPQDAQRIMQSCQVGLTVKEMRRARAEADRLAREQRRMEREAAKAARLAECGPAPCPANRAKPNLNGVGGPSTPGPS